MLDAYIIDRLRQQQDSQSRIPLHVPLGDPRPPSDDQPPQDAPEERGIATIDFSI